MAFTKITVVRLRSVVETSGDFCGPTDRQTELLVAANEVKRSLQLNRQNQITICLRGPTVTLANGRSQESQVAGLGVKPSVHGEEISCLDILNTIPAEFS